MNVVQDVTLIYVSAQATKVVPQPGGCSYKELVQQRIRGALHTNPADKLTDGKLDNAKLFEDA